ELRVAERTNEVNQQISQIETYINDDEIDVSVVVPFDGAPLTGVALDAMHAGIPVVNVDREFSDENASRVTVLGDNYGMGVSAGEYICERLEGAADPEMAELAGHGNLTLTQERGQRLGDAIASSALD